MKSIPVTLNFDNSRLIGAVDIDDNTLNMSHVEEYFLAPQAQYNKSTSQFEITGYGLVHISQIPTMRQWLDQTNAAVNEAKL